MGIFNSRRALPAAGEAASEGRGCVGEAVGGRPLDALRAFDSTNGRSDTCVFARARVLRFCFCLCSLLCFRCVVVLLRLNFLPLRRQPLLLRVGANDPLLLPSVAPVAEILLGRKKRTQFHRKLPETSTFDCSPAAGRKETAAATAPLRSTVTPTHVPWQLCVYTTRNLGSSLGKKG